MVYVGIDPGKSGGIVALSEAGTVLVCSKMPDSERGVLDVLTQARQSSGGGAFAVLEFVRSRPGQSAPATFTFGRGYGGLRMALVALGVPFDEAVPAKWQKAVGALSGGDKNVTKRRAEELFPTVKVTHAIADALLIAEYCRRSRAGKL